VKKILLFFTLHFPGRYRHPGSDFFLFLQPPPFIPVSQRFFKIVAGITKDI